MSGSTAPAPVSKVTWGFTASLDGFITGPDHDMAWIEAAPPMDEAVTTRLAEAVGVIISGRRGYDAARAQAEERDLTAEAYGGAWSGTEIILTHRPEELADDPSVLALDVDVVEAVRRAQELAVDGRDVQIISADIARQALEHDLIDELQVFSAPVFLGDGTRIFDVPGGRLVEWELLGPISGAEAAFGRIYRPRRPSTRPTGAGSDSAPR
ncbi:dihydrofolate reductase family protein [Brachybacterium sp. YJGR34]|uniref:dihydrofolate reductase family protein n=1 Tax=Brachybacterium sp. YJGR34 TaxID=2059911 RepID=UPI000E0AE379|nr:dihydrofolate reductase family protein [Brachybacterium sp. YJGR34]